MSGLKHLAGEVRSAGRGPDRHLVHLSDAELGLLRRGWGEPDVNPRTGLPEYGWFDSIAQLIPAAVSAFWPGAGEGIGAALGAEGPWSSVVGNGILGAGSGLLTSGGDWKKALMGGAMGAGTAALFPYLANELSGTDAGKWLGVSGGNNTVFGNAPQGDMASRYFGGDAGSRIDSYASDPAFQGPAGGALATAATGALTGRGGSGGSDSGTSSLLKYALPAVTLLGILSGNRGQSGGAPTSVASSSGGGGELPKLSLSMRPKDTSTVDWYHYGERPKKGTSFFDQQWMDAQGKPVGAADGGYVQGYAGGGGTTRRGIMGLFGAAGADAVLPKGTVDKLPPVPAPTPRGKLPFDRSGLKHWLENEHGVGVGDFGEAATPEDNKILDEIYKDMLRNAPKDEHYLNRLLMEQLDQPRIHPDEFTYSKKWRRDVEPQWEALQDSMSNWGFPRPKKSKIEDDPEGFSGMKKGGYVSMYADGGPTTRRMIPGSPDVPVPGETAPELEELLERLGGDDRRTQADLMRWLSQFGGRRPIDYDSTQSPGTRTPWERPNDEYDDKPEDLYAAGGPTPGRLGALGTLQAAPRNYVGAGPGSGRGDQIPARLSPNEYVLTSEDVSMLGDGSPDAGAKRLDQMRVNLRKHKGQALARGRISPNAKSPEQYMRGGRI